MITKITPKTETFLMHLQFHDLMWQTVILI